MCLLTKHRLLGCGLSGWSQRGHRPVFHSQPAARDGALPHSGMAVMSLSIGAWVNGSLHKQQYRGVRNTAGAPKNHQYMYMGSSH